MGGRFKAEPEDFRVEEVPAYLPCGEGEHLFLWVEKRALSTPQVATALAAQLGLSEREVSYAGLKDRQAVARQWFCVPSRVEAALGQMNAPRIRVVHHKRHRNKLRTGQLRGNRFQIRIRGPLDLGAGREALERLRRRGLANYFGPQRFGRSRQNAAAGRALLLGQAAAGSDRFQRKLFLSAFQSLLFNRALSARIEGGAFALARAGDVMQRLATGGLFVCAQPKVDQPRIDSFEISPAGPLFGPKMMSPAGEVAEAEAELLAQAGVTLGDFSAGGGETRGGRRAYRLAAPDCEFAEEGPNVWLCFELPRGTYATALLREVLGPQGEPAEELEPL